MTITKSLIVAVFLMFLLSSVSAEDRRVEADGIIHMSAFELPESAYLSQETRTALKNLRDIYMKDYGEAFVSKDCPAVGAYFEKAKMEDMPAIRECLAKAFYKTSLYKMITDRYEVDVKGEKIGGVYTEVFTPGKGISGGNKNRVLINLHGGGLVLGARTISHIESMPISSLGGIKVISVDYRMGPENKFPAASEDVASVYRELLKKYKPENIGIFGCSGGGLLTSQSIAWFQKHDLPMPGAVGMFCAAAPVALDSNTYKAAKSDGGTIGGFISGRDFSDFPQSNRYLQEADLMDPLASPGGYDDVMARFPPSLLIAGSRDFLISGVLYTHAQLTRLDVEADLHIWEGMAHGFHYWPELPESHEAYRVIVKFFDKHLGE